MSFDGVVESMSQARITGWAGYALPSGERAVPTLTLRFHTLGTFSPTSTPERHAGNTGFVFVLPGQFQNLSWARFVEDFHGVHAEYETDRGIQRWMVPLYKSVMMAFDTGNRTGLVAERLRDYSSEPRPDGRIAALTIAYNENIVLPLWARYYAKQLGAENLYVIDQGSDESYDSLPEGVNIIRVPRDRFDTWLITRQVELMQRFLLETYDTVLYADSDEFICASPELRGGRSFRQTMLGLGPSVAIPRGYNLHHDLKREGAYDPSRPLLDQRRFIKYEPWMDKPAISRLPLNWVPGFHSAREGGERIPGLYLLHLRWFDLDLALRKGGIYRSSKWDPYDIEQRFGVYQRDDDAQIEKKFVDWAQAFARLAIGAVFDESHELSVIPDWMKEEISV